MDPNECDLDLLQRLRSAQPLWLDGHDDGTVVSWDDLDRDLRETFLTVATESEPTRIDGGLYVTAFEWISAYEDVWRLITTRMRLRSLELAVAGPTVDELTSAPTLSRWVPVRSEGGYRRASYRRSRCASRSHRPSDPHIPALRYRSRGRLGAHRLAMVSAR